MIDAYVEGRPIPFSSSVFTRLASLYRGGGSVNFCCGSSLFSPASVPRSAPAAFAHPRHPDRLALRTRLSLSFFFSASGACSSTFRKPSNFRMLPLTRKSYVRSAFAAISTVVWSNTAGVIWLETNLCQISLYSRYCSSDRYCRIESGVYATFVGRIASCASCASVLALVLVRRLRQILRAQLAFDVLPRLRNRIRDSPASNRYACT